MEKVTQNLSEFYVTSFEKDCPLVQPTPGKSLFLLCEHIVRDGTSEFKQPAQTQNKFADITIDNLSFIIQNPTQSLQCNLHLGQDIDQIIHELQNTWNFIKSQQFYDWVETVYLLETSSRKQGQNIDKLIEIQRRLDQTQARIKLIPCWSPSLTQYAAASTKDQFLNELVFDLKNGWQGLKPGAIGEIDLDQVSQDKIKIWIECILEYAATLKRAPLTIMKASKYQQIEFLKGLIPTDLQPQFVIVTPFFQNTLQETMSKTQIGQQADLSGILEAFKSSNFTFSLPFQSDSPQHIHFTQQTLQLILQQGYTDRIVLGNCLTYRTQLLKYGGWYGYAAMVKLLQDTCQSLGKNQDFAKGILSQNALKLAQWREQQIEVVIEGPKFECWNCKKMFEEEKTAKFEKMDMAFCSMGCISAFRKKGGFD